MEFFTPPSVCSHINIIKDITIIVYTNHIRTAFFHRFPSSCFDFDTFFLNMLCVMFSKQAYDQSSMF